MNFIFYTRWYERVILVSLAILNTFLPLQIMVKLNYRFAAFMSRNPAHSFAKNMVSMIKERKENGR